jgi:hypothetical protein
MYIAWVSRGPTGLTIKFDQIRTYFKFKHRDQKLGVSDGGPFPPASSRQCLLLSTSHTERQPLLLYSTMCGTHSCKRLRQAKFKTAARDSMVGHCWTTLDPYSNPSVPKKNWDRSALKCHQSPLISSWMTSFASSGTPFSSLST